MNDDWRLRVDFHESGLLHKATARLSAVELQHDLKTAFLDRVIVSVDGAELFCYAGNREQLERVDALIQREAQEHGWHVSSELMRWHPVAEDWQDPEKPLPEGEAEHAAERAELMGQERAESEKLGMPEYEVRVTCGDRQRAAAFADKLRGEGLPCVQHAKFLLIGALDEDSANALAERVRGEVPSDSTVTTEASMEAVIATTGGNPLALIGGMAG